MEKELSLTTAAGENQNQSYRVTCHSKYRLDLIAEILDHGHAASKDEHEFREQVERWSRELAGISTRKLLACFIRVKRNRAACEIPFDQMALTIEEMKTVGEILKCANTKIKGASHADN